MARRAALKLAARIRTFFALTAVFLTAACGAAGSPSSRHGTPPPSQTYGEGPSSSYQDLDLSACEILERNDESGGTLRRCTGHEGTPLFIRESDGRYDIDVGKQDPAFLPRQPFTRLGETAEWRLYDGEPVAVIIRMNFAAADGSFSGGDSKLAVVNVATAVRPSCYLALVPIDARPSQNERARQIADNAVTMDCAFD